MLIDWRSRTSYLWRHTVNSQDGGHDVCPPLAACSSIRRLPASPPSACDVIDSLRALQFLIHSTFVLVASFSALTLLIGGQKAFILLHAVEVEEARWSRTEGRRIKCSAPRSKSWRRHWGHDPLPALFCRHCPATTIPKVIFGDVA